jgi:hypothetical protein
MGMSTEKFVRPETLVSSVCMRYVIPSSCSKCRLRMEQAGHEVPYYQPEASLEMFRRVLLGVDLASGDLKFNSNYSSSGIANATHTEPFVALTSSTSSAVASSSSAAMTGAPEIMI